MTKRWGNMRIYVLVFLIGGACCLPDAIAQSTFDGSVYSSFGIGESVLFSSSQGHAMGGLGLAIATPNYVNMSNPASWASQIFTRFTAGMEMQQLVATDASANESQLVAGTIGPIAISFPIRQERLSFLAGLEPLSRVGYRVHQLGELEPDDLTGAAPYAVDYQGRGGLQQIKSGVGYRVTENLRVGASVNFIFGRIEHNRLTTFEQRDIYSESFMSRSTTYRGVSGTVGSHFFVRGVLTSEDALAVGATVSLPAELRATQTYTLGSTLDRDTLAVPEQGTTSIPLRAGAGVAYSPSPVVIFSADGMYEAWSNLRSDLPLSAFSEAALDYRDRIRAGGGIQIVPGAMDQTTGFFGRTSYRLGGYYEQAYFNLQNRADINTVALTGGFGFPTLLPGTTVDLNLEVGTRGVAEADLVRDLFYKVTMTVNFGERWFMERRLN